jgi:hypothetical protein
VSGLFRSVEAGSLVVYRHGELVHVWCVTEVLDSNAVQKANDAATLLEEMIRFPSARSAVRRSGLTMCAGRMGGLSTSLVPQPRGRPVASRRLPLRILRGLAGPAEDAKLGGR